MASFISERNCVKIWRCLLDREIPISWKDTEKSCQAKKGGMKTQFEKKILKWGECIIPIRYK